MKGVTKALGMAPPKPDTSAIKKQQALVDEQEGRLRQQEADALSEEEQRKKRDAASTRARKGRAGGASLLSGLETGVEPVQGGRRTTLG